MRFGVPIASQKDGEARGLAFDFLEGSRGAPVMTGHANGLITINISEADSAERERQRIALGEPYRTLLGHMRHEAGHYYWDLLVADGGRIEESRAVFGDERESYSEALERYYAARPEARLGGRPTSAPTRRCTPGRTSPRPGPTICTWSTRSTPAPASGSRSIRGWASDPRDAAVIDFDPYRPPDLERLVRAWLPLTAAVNSLNRSMGQPDLYPFDPSPNVLAKVRFIHDLLHPPGNPRARREPFRRLTPPRSARPERGSMRSSPARTAASSCISRTSSACAAA